MLLAVGSVGAPLASPDCGGPGPQHLVRAAIRNAQFTPALFADGHCIGSQVLTAPTRVCCRRNCRVHHATPLLSNALARNTSIGVNYTQLTVVGVSPAMEQGNAYFQRFLQALVHATSYDALAALCAAELPRVLGASRVGVTLSSGGGAWSGASSRQQAADAFYATGPLSTGGARGVSRRPSAAGDSVLYPHGAGGFLLVQPIRCGDVELGALEVTLRDRIAPQAMLQAVHAAVCAAAGRLHALASRDADIAAVRGGGWTGAAAARATVGCSEIAHTHTHTHTQPHTRLHAPPPPCLNCS
jgi:hypothetical protein